MKKTQETPFYALIDNQMTSCHTPNDVRTASVRPLVTSRPCTPLATQRTLFGSTQRTNRPPSATTFSSASYQCPPQPRRLPALKGTATQNNIDEHFEEVQSSLVSLNEQQPNEVTPEHITKFGLLIDKSVKLAGWKKDPQRTQTLKTIFRLLSSKNPAVVLQVAKLLIILEVGKQNRTPLAKVIFSLAKDENNDQYFLQLPDLSDCLLRLVEMMEPKDEWEALTYSLGAVKLLSLNLQLQQLLSKAGAVSTLSNLLQTILKYAKKEELCTEEMEHILFQITGSLRNMADLSSNRHQFVSSGAVVHLVSLLGPFAHDLDIVLNVARILSKLTMYYEICNCLTESSGESLKTVSGLLDTMRQEGQVMVRFCFSIGNIAAKNEHARQVLFRECKIVPILLQLIDDQATSNACVNKRHQTDLINFSKTESEPESSLSQDVEIKAIRILANMSISPNVGPELASDAELFRRLLDRINIKPNTEPDELGITTLATLGNLSYYYSVQNQLFSSLNLSSSIKFIVAQLNYSANEQVLSECLRLSSNVSRSEGPRKLLSLSKVGTITLKLMTEEHLNKDIIFLCCGLLVNLMAEESTRLNVKEENGVESFTQVLKRSAEEGDWQLAGVVCQLLWNYLAYSSSTPNSPPIRLIVNLLQRHLSVSTASTDDLWKLEFCPVATRLRTRIHENESGNNKCSEN